MPIDSSTILPVLFLRIAQDIDDTLLIISDKLPGNVKWMKGARVLF